MDSCRVCCRENMLLSSVVVTDWSLAFDCLRGLDLFFDVVSVLLEDISLVVGMLLILGERS